MTTTQIQLPKVTQTRINRLAQASGRSPAAMLRFVLRDGFDAVELSIKENAQADAEFVAGATARHTDVMRDAFTVVRQAKREALAAA
jgi:predicted transcriptional regulator